MRAPCPLAALLALTTLAACGGHTSEIPAVDLAEARKTVRYQRLLIHPFTPAPGVRDPQDALQRCRAAALKYLAEQAVFKGVDRAEAAPHLPLVTAEVRVIVTALRIVTAANRLQAGSLAGSSEMALQVEVRDRRTGRRLASRRLRSSNDAMGATWSEGSSDQRLPAEVGALLGRYLLYALARAVPPG